MTHERWLPVPGFSGRYSASTLGRIRSEPRSYLNNGTPQSLPQRILKAGPSKSHGYPVVNIRRSDRSRPELVHRLVLETFRGPCPPGMEGAHGDGDKLNTKLSNLRWATPSANNKDKLAHGTQVRGEMSSTAALTDAQAKAIRESNLPQRALAAHYGVSQPTIQKIKSGKTYVPAL